MDASKQNARRALEAVKSWPGASPAKALVVEFLAAAMNRLPNQESIDRDRLRRREKKAS